MPGAFLPSLMSIKDSEHSNDDFRDYVGAVKKSLDAKTEMEHSSADPTSKNDGDDESRKLRNEESESVVKRGNGQWNCKS